MNRSCSDEDRAKSIAEPACESNELLIFNVTQASWITQYFMEVGLWQSMMRSSSAEESMA
jgi:hypothetical protein